MHIKAPRYVVSWRPFWGGTDNGPRRIAALATGSWGRRRSATKALGTFDLWFSQMFNTMTSVKTCKIRSMLKQNSNLKIWLIKIFNLTSTWFVTIRRQNRRREKQSNEDESEHDGAWRISSWSHVLSWNVFDDN